MFLRLIQTRSDKATIIIRFLVGCVFVSEGIQKFLFPETLGAGRFHDIGLPAADVLSNLVGMFEICCGLLVLVGLLTRLACVPLIVIILVAIFTTKTDVYLAKGFWEVLHASRTDWSMLLGSLFLLIKGAGYYSFDFSIWLNKKSWA